MDSRRETEDAALPAERVTEALPDDGAPARPIVREGDVLLGKYRVEGVIGAGGMGIVVAATHVQLGTRVAVKLLRPDKDPGGLGAARLLREARAAARVEGEHVARVLDVDALDARTPCIVMERLDGRDLGAELLARGPLPVEDAIDDLLQACEAVAAAHAAGIVHRDLKPSNLFLAERADGPPRIKVLDFGIAKAEGGEGAALTASNAVLGSPVYMSPEQIRSASTVDPRTDVWSLGVILFELLTGRLPFEGGSAPAQLAAIAADPPIPLGALRPDAPAGLEAVILRCLEKDVDRRMPDVAALARALAPFAPARAAGSEARVAAALGRPLSGARSAEVPWRPAARSGPGRRRTLVAATAAALLACAAIAVAARGTIHRWALAGPPAPAATATQAAPRFAPAHAHRVTFDEGCEEFPWWAPDGGSLVYDGASGKDTRVFLLDLATSARRMLTTEPGWQIAPSVSPRGEVAYLRMATPEPGTYASTLDGAAPRRLSPKGLVRPSWSPDGAFVWVGGGAGPERIDARTGEVSRKLLPLDETVALNVLELPDGRALTRAIPQNANGPSGLILYAAGSDQGAWLWRAELDSVLERTADGASVFVAKAAETQGVELWRVPLDGAPPEPVAGDGVRPTKGLHLSPDGRRVAWSDCRAVSELSDLSPGHDEETLVSRPRAGSKEWKDDQPSAIPGTSSILMLSTRMGGALRPCVVDLDNRSPPRCLDVGGLDASSPSPSADGRWFSFSVSHKGVFVAPLDGSAPPRRVAEARAHDTLSMPTISPDGREVYYRVDADGVSPRIEAVPFAGGPPRRALEPGEYGLSFSPRAGAATFQVYTHDNLSIPMLLDPATKQRRPLVRGLAEGDFGRAVWSASGARVAVQHNANEVLEIDVAAARVRRRFDGGNDQVTGVTYVGEDLVISRVVWVGDIWVADL